jgi:hypothetical protein
MLFGSATEDGSTTEDNMRPVVNLEEGKSHFSSCVTATDMNYFRRSFNLV